MENLSSNKRKIYVVGPALEYANWMEGELVNSIIEADLVVFTGGEDVDPSIYDEPSHPQTYSNKNRDIIEKVAFKHCLTHKKHMIGICRGSQFLCVMNGGKLVQHQQNPSSYHNIDTFDNKTIVISSSHHQAAYPYNLVSTDYKLLGWTKGISKYHQNGESQEMLLVEGKEVEMLYFPKTKCLGIQGHPEWMYRKGNEPNETIIYLRDLLDKFMKDEIN